MSGSTRPPFPSAPSDPTLRRLGVGPSGGSGRPVRAQLVVIIVLSLTLLAVPLYLMRRPSAKALTAPESSGLVPAASASASASASALPLPDAAPFTPEKLKLSEIRKVRCGATARSATEGETCDSLPAFEKALTEAVKATLECAPRSAQPGTINFVLEVDFTKQKLHIFPGASGQWKGPKARRATKCATNALVAPDFSSVVHQYRYYAIAILVTYPPNITADASPAK